MDVFPIQPQIIDETENDIIRLTFARIRKHQLFVDSLVPHTAEHRAAVSVLFILQDSAQLILDAQQALQVTRAASRKPAA